MNRTVLKAGLFLFACSTFAISRPVHAKALSLTANDVNPTIAMSTTPFIDTLKPNDTEAQAKADSGQAEPLKPVEHIVQPGESLSSIAANYQTTWKRLYDKNTTITSPDVINVNEHLVVPTADEVLPERVIPVVAPVETQPSSRAVTANVKPKTPTYSPGSSAGNGYVRGYCTWYAKNRRPDLPNNLGNAISWVSNAAAQGIATGGTPRAGAIGQSGNHVVYIESVNGDGTVTVSEMNWEGLGVISSRTASAGSFSYIY